MVEHLCGESVDVEERLFGNLGGGGKQYRNRSFCATGVRVDRCVLNAAQKIW